MNNYFPEEQKINLIDKISLQSSQAIEGTSYSIYPEKGKAKGNHSSASLYKGEGGDNSREIHQEIGLPGMYMSTR